MPSCASCWPARPSWLHPRPWFHDGPTFRTERAVLWFVGRQGKRRSEEHTSELQSLRHLGCRLLLEKKKTNDGRSARENHKDEQAFQLCIRCCDVWGQHGWIRGPYEPLRTCETWRDTR